MTFEEWWKINIRHDCKKCKQISLGDCTKCIAKRSWEAAQPKWTLCKDAMPDKTGNYLWLDNDRHVHIDHYWADMPLMPYVIAWMPLPEVPAEINSGLTKQGANI